MLSRTISDKTLFIGINNVFYSSIEDCKKYEHSPMYFNPIGAGAMLPHGRSYNQEFKNFIKTLNPNCQLVLGGPHSVDAEHNKDFDYLIPIYQNIETALNSAHQMKMIADKIRRAKLALAGQIPLEDVQDIFDDYYQREGIEAEPVAKH